MTKWIDHYSYLQTNPRLSLYFISCNSNKNYAKLWSLSHEKAVGGGYMVIPQVDYQVGWLSCHQDCWYECKNNHDIMRAQQQEISNEKAVGCGWMAIILVNFSVGQFSSHWDHWYVGENPCDNTRVQHHSIVVL